ncbi:ABC transporter ATP-binding protein [Occultella aeris]|uniref:Lipid A export ATP-binding/permease protein MsbA n=1 Tax=Occultella aeris TaxID=2761496 RepID=A0A7M4DQW8_9MICO|nr:ABC transporter ATP-binding protein [Occultella aeris]VZO39862.1 Lipid A export ATP-binding/permease protein MsbA [Occultella aeris]
MSATTPGTSARIESTSSLGVLGTLRAGLALSPAMRTGIGVTLALAVLATAGRLIVPIVVQQTTDVGILAPGGVDVGLVLRLCGIAAVGLLGAAACTTWVNVRLFRAAEAGLLQLRVRAFRHVHDLSVLTQNTERRGSLVSRVTSDVDTISLFVQWGGMQLVLSVLQIAGATVAMLFYSWQLTVVVWLAFAPMIVLAPKAQKALNVAYGTVRLRVGAMLGRISESIVGAQTIRSYGAGARTQRRMDEAIGEHRDAAVRAQAFASLAFSSGVLLSGLALGAVVVVGTLLGIDGDLTVGGLLAFLFLVQIFTGPVQSATEVLNELQNAVAGWRRVISVVHTPLDITEPDEPTPAGPRGPAALDFTDVTYTYPGTAAAVLHDIDLAIPAGARVAVVGETGSGKTTLAKLLTRMMDPDAGSVRLNDVDLREIALADLRSRVVIVPQEGFLFDDTIAGNVAYGRPDIDADGVVGALERLGLGDWLATLPLGVHTDVGQRGESLSAGERQLVAIARAYLADADVLVLDEATSAVDPATEHRISRALAELTQGRTSVAIAHRLSTAEAADLVVVVDAGRIVELGPHTTLVAAGGVYARMHATWISASE